jgi:hypothetical protein
MDEKIWMIRMDRMIPAGLDEKDKRDEFPYGNGWLDEQNV